MKKRALLLMAVMGMVFSTAPPLVGGAELQYPSACYQEKELQAVRAWEAQWAGKKITSANIDQVKEYLPETFTSS